jgi:hypothetical protein
MFDYRSPPTNPLGAFLGAGVALLNIAGGEDIPPAAYAAFTRNSEERTFCTDLCDRVHRIAFAFDRLCELTEIDNTISRQRKERFDDLGQYQLTAEMLQDGGRWDVETDLLTFYIYYELKSVTDMLRQWDLEPTSGSELQYALKARDRFLAHAEFCRVSPRANRGKCIPRKGLTQCDIASLRQWDSVTQAEYLKKLNMSEPIDREAEVCRNNKIILSRERNEKLTEQEVIRIKAFGVRELYLEKAIGELAQLLDPGALSRIRSVCNDAITNFGFEPIPDGPTFVCRL